MRGSGGHGRRAGRGRAALAGTTRVGAILAVAIGVLGCGPGTGGAPERTAGGGPSAPPAGPYEAVRRGGGLLFLAGQLGTLDDGSLVPGGIQPETRRALEKIRALVEGEGSTMDDVVKCTVFLADVAEWDAMNVVYAGFFPGRKPARTAVGGIGVPREGRVEIECLAVAR
jgi:2-iminobutanoate/2-iminopropanoate deaminase